MSHAAFLIHHYKVKTTMIRTHAIGLRGHFSIDKYLLETADHYGISIERTKDNRYHISSQNEEFNLSKLCPSFIEHDVNIFEKSDLKQFLEFLHQPIRISLEHCHVKTPEKSRQIIHQLLRSVTTGSVRIPEYSNAELEKESAACHANTEKEMRDADYWRENIEIGNSNLTPASIPYSSFDPKKGFVFCLNYNHSDPNQTKMNEVCKSFISKATNKVFQSDEDILSLSADELYRFCELTAQDDTIIKLIEEAAFEEGVQDALTNINKRTVNLSISQSFKRVLENSQSTTDSKEQLKLLFQCSTALSPIVNSNVMRDAWSRYQFSERKDAPLDDIVQEFSILQAVIERHLVKGTTSQEELEAISQEFYPLLAFAGKFAHALQLEEVENFLQGSTLADLSLSDSVLDDRYLQTLKTLRRAAGQKQSVLGQVAEATADSTLEFIGDIVNFIKESPKVAATFVGLATTLYVINGSSADEMQAVTETLMIPDYGSGEYESLIIDDAALPEEARKTQNWHWDMGPLGMYKHFMYNNAVIGPAQTMLDGIRVAGSWSFEQLGITPNPDPEFSQMANAVVKPLADRLFDINVFQNASHAAFWMYMFSKGAKHGLKGGSKIGQLFAPITDLGYLSTIKSLESIRLREKPQLHDRLMDLQKNIPPLIKGHNSHEIDLLSGMAKAAILRTDVEKTLPKEEGSTSLKLKMAGTSHNISINSQSIKSTLSALAQFDFALEHIASEIGIGEVWHQIFLKERLNSVTKAFEIYKEDRDELALKRSLKKGLKELVQAQIRQTGKSPIYETVFDQKPSSQERHLLSRDANIRFGRLKREDSLKVTFNKVSDESLPYIKRGKAAAKASGITLWSGIVETSRAFQKAYDAVPHKKVLLTSLGAVSTAAVTLDMSGQSLDLLGTTYGQVSDMISSATGGATATGVTTGTFLVYNFWEDVLGVHILSGAALLSAGAVYHYVNKETISPLIAAGSEHFGKPDDFNQDNTKENITYISEDSLSPCFQCANSETCTIVETIPKTQSDRSFEGNDHTL